MKFLSCRLSLFVLTISLSTFVLPSCTTVDSGLESEGAEVKGDWWSLAWDDAANQRSESLELASGVRVAARSIKVLSRNEEGTPVAVRARGNALVQSAASGPIRALGYEVEVTDDAIQVKGNPVAVQKKSMLVATEETTVITIEGNELSVEGPAKFESVETGPPTIQKSVPAPVPTPPEVTQSKKATPSPSSRPAASPAKPGIKKSEAKPKVEVTKPTPPPPPAPATPKPAAKPTPKPAPTPAPKLPQMRLPEDDDLPVPGGNF